MYIVIDKQDVGAASKKELDKITLYFYIKRNVNINVIQSMLFYKIRIILISLIV